MRRGCAGAAPLNTPRRRLRKWACFHTLWCAAQTHDAVVTQPRLTGYFVGDLLTQRVLLERDGHPFTPAALPAAGRVSAWFERRGTTVATDAALHRWLVVEYQILNAPPKLMDVKLPAWQLSVTNGAGGPPTTLRIPAVLINIAPLSPPGSPEQVGTRDLRPDRISPVIPIAPIRRALSTLFQRFGTHAPRMDSMGGMAKPASDCHPTIRARITRDADAR